MKTEPFVKRLIDNIVSKGIEEGFIDDTNGQLLRTSNPIGNKIIDLIEAKGYKISRWNGKDNYYSIR